MFLEYVFLRISLRALLKDLKTLSPFCIYPSTTTEIVLPTPAVWFTPVPVCCFDHISIPSPAVTGRDNFIEHLLFLGLYPVTTPISTPLLLGDLLSILNEEYVS